MNKRILILVMAVLLAVSIQVFAEESAAITDPGIKPDSPLYTLDRLIEKIQIAIITDAVKEAEALAGMAQERLAESKAMVTENNIEKATTAVSEYKELMNKAIDVIDAAAKDGKAVTKTIDKIVKYDIEDEEILEKLMDKVPVEYTEELKKAIEALPEKESIKPETKEEVEKISAASVILTGELQDKALLEKIEKAELNNRQLAAAVSLSEQSGKTIGEVVDLFVTNEKGIGKTIIELKLAPKDAMKDINKTFKELKKELKTGLVKSEGLNNETDEKDRTVKEVKDDADSKNNKESVKTEKKLEKAAEKLEKKIEQAEKKYDKKLEKK
jgi:hypothetical protein